VIPAIAKLSGNTGALMATEIGRDDFKLKYASLLVKSLLRYAVLVVPAAGSGAG
jgi:hypothetical protein